MARIHGRSLAPFDSDRARRASGADRAPARDDGGMGRFKVAIHDNTRAYQPWEKPYFVLSDGDVYNMKTRTIVKYGDGVPPPRPGPANPGDQLGSSRK